MQTSATVDADDARTYPAAPRIAVSCAVLRERNGRREVLLVRRGSPPAEGRWAFPGGSLELGETLAEGAVREVREETGLTIGPPRFVTHHEVVERDRKGQVLWHYVLACFVSRASDTAEPIAASDAADAIFAPLSRLLEPDVMPSCAQVLRLGGVPVSPDGNTQA